MSDSEAGDYQVTEQGPPAEEEEHLDFGEGEENHDGNHEGNEDKVSSEETPGENWWSAWCNAIVAGPLMSVHRIRELVNKAEKHAKREKKYFLRSRRAAPDSAVAGEAKVAFLQERVARLEAMTHALQATERLNSERSDRMRERLLEYEGTIQRLRNERNQARTGALELGDINASLLSRNEALTVEIGAKADELRDKNAQLANLRGTGLVSNGLDASKVLATALRKPNVLDGEGLTKQNGAQRIEEWHEQVVDFTSALKLSEGDALHAAKSYLVGQAARAWSTHLAILQASNKPVTLAELKLCLLRRFAATSLITSAREELDKCVLGSKKCRTLASYVIEFDRICALIPDLEPKDKWWRFVAGIRAHNAHLVAMCCQDPQTRDLFPDYDLMRTATLNAAAHAAEYVMEVKMAGDKFHSKEAERTSKRPRTPGAGVSGGVAQQGNKQQGSAEGPKKPVGKFPQQGKGKEKTGGPGQAPGSKGSPWRPPLVFRYCQEHGYCTNCFQRGHTKKDCPADTPAEGFPPGYTEQ